MLPVKEFMQVWRGLSDFQKLSKYNQCCSLYQLGGKPHLKEYIYAMDKERGLK